MRRIAIFVVFVAAIVTMVMPSAFTRNLLRPQAKA